MSSLTSSPSSGTGNPGNGPVTELHDENVAVSWYTAIASSYPVTMTTSWCGSRCTGHCVAEMVEVRVRVGDERVVAEEVDRSKSVDRSRSQHGSRHLVLDDLVVGEPELEQHLVGVLAVLGCMPRTDGGVSSNCTGFAGSTNSAPLDAVIGSR